MISKKKLRARLDEILSMSGRMIFAMERLALVEAAKDPKTVARIRKVTTDQFEVLASFVRRHNGEHAKDVKAGIRDKHGKILCE